jgi:hypothetical protein
MRAVCAPQLVLGAFEGCSVGWRVASQRQARKRYCIYITDGKEFR